ncbi:MAG: DUF1844 domain-containing protein [Myxococcaceae bacterium]|nr:DUF1844 domain-containing protein [Myxococcaceae bacterium]
MTERRGETFVLKEEAAPSAISFSTLVMGLASTTLIHLGDAANPETGQTAPNLDLARQSLDLLAVLQAKTRGNLDSAETALFDNVLADLRLRFVALSKR